MGLYAPKDRAAVVMLMRLGTVLALLALSTTAVCEDQPAVNINAPYVARVNQPFLFQVSLRPPSQETVKVTLDLTTGVTFSQTTFELKGTQQKSVVGKILSAPPSGLIYILADADGYQEGWSVVDVGYDGHLKPSWVEPLTSDVPTTMSFGISDKDGKPILVEGDLELRLETTDGILNGDKKSTTLKLPVPAGARVTPQFQLAPRSQRGGNVHLTAALAVEGYSHPITQEQFVFASQPAWWIPVILAVLGGLLHGIYKVVRTPVAEQNSRVNTYLPILLTSCIAGFVGYLFADFDLLGLKLDPNVLRTYPIVGFLFSYLGIEGLLSDRLGKNTTPRT